MELIFGFFGVISIVGISVWFVCSSKAKKANDALTLAKVRTENEILNANNKLDELSSALLNRTSTLGIIIKKLNEYTSAYNNAQVSIDKFHRESNNAYDRLNKQRMITNMMGGAKDLSAIFYYANESKYNKSRLNVRLKDGSNTVARAYVIINQR